MDAGDPAGAQTAKTRKRGAPGYYTHESRTRLPTAQLQQARRSVPRRRCRAVSVRARGAGAEGCAGKVCVLTDGMSGGLTWLAGSSFAAM